MVDEDLDSRSEENIQSSQAEEVCSEHLKKVSSAASYAPEPPYRLLTPPVQIVLEKVDDSFSSKGLIKNIVPFVHNKSRKKRRRPK